MKQQIQHSPPNFTTYSVRKTDFETTIAEANRYGIRKSDFLGVLMRAWRKLTDKQKHDAIQTEPADSVSVN